MRDRREQWQSSATTRMKSSERDPGSVRPFSNRKSLAFVRDHCRYTGVSDLFSASSPSHISGFIVAIVVWVPIKFGSIWALTHVIKECLKGFAPLLAHGDSASTVSIKIMRTRIKAAFLGFAPRFESLLVDIPWVFLLAAIAAFLVQPQLLVRRRVKLVPNMSTTVPHAQRHFHLLLVMYARTVSRPNCLPVRSWK